jgi:hypothetical protein
MLKVFCKGVKEMKTEHTVITVEFLDDSDIRVNSNQPVSTIDLIRLLGVVLYLIPEGERERAVNSVLEIIANSGVVPVTEENDIKEQ